uniref:Uncharacterized protein gs82 n=1 Tax=Homo sapiens TaxID=9606 RepID=Q96S01_HUMAN|nr:unknown [Homo sapiens]
MAVRPMAAWPSPGIMALPCPALSCTPSESPGSPPALGRPVTLQQQLQQKSRVSTGPPQGCLQGGEGSSGNTMELPPLSRKTAAAAACPENSEGTEPQAVWTKGNCLRLLSPGGGDGLPAPQAPPSDLGLQSRAGHTRSGSVHVQAPSTLGTARTHGPPGAPALCPAVPPHPSAPDAGSQAEGQEDPVAPARLPGPAPPSPPLAGWMRNRHGGSGPAFGSSVPTGAQGQGGARTVSVEGRPAALWTQRRPWRLLSGPVPQLAITKDKPQTTVRNLLNPQSGTGGLAVSRRIPSQPQAPPAPDEQPGAPPSTPPPTSGPRHPPPPHGVGIPGSLLIWATLGFRDHPGWEAAGASLERARREWGLLITSVLKTWLQDTEMRELMHVEDPSRGVTRVQAQWAVPCCVCAQGQPWGQTRSRVAGPRISPGAAGSTPHDRMP